MDFAERLPYLFHPELIYKLNSKRWLAECALRSANDDIIDCEISCQDHQLKTDKGKEEWYYGGSECHKCTAGIEAEIQRILNIIKKRQYPYVLKLTQSLSSVGTILVQSEEERNDAIKEIEDYLTTYLARITKDNAHLNTTTLILSDFVPGKTNAINLHVNRDGSIVFLGACHQLATGATGRQATAITYADQKELEKKFQKTNEKIGKTLHDEGYHGPVGADIMEDKDGNQFTIDLNVRTPLSLVLYLLKGHFNDERGFGVALVYECMMLKISRDDFEKKFEKEFKEGRIVIMGSAKLGPDKEKYGYGLILAGEDKDAVDKLSDRVIEYEA